MFFSAIAAAIEAIYTTGGTLYCLLVFIIDSNLLVFFYSTIATAIDAKRPDRSHSSYF